MAAGSIIIDLLMRTGAFETDSKRAEKRLKEFEKQAKQIGTAIGTATTAGVLALTAITVQAINFADQIDEMSNRVGINTETLSGWGYAAKLSGTNFESLTNAIPKLSKNLAEAMDAGSKQADLFKALGISVTDAEGRLRRVEDVLPEIADRFKGLDNPTQEAALAMELFGRSGAELLEFLNRGSDGIQELIDHAAELGIIIGGDSAAAAAQFKDQLDDLQALALALGLQIAERLLPDLIELTRQFSEFVKEGDAAAEIADVISAGFKVVDGTIRAVTSTVRGITADLIAMANALLAVNKASRLDFRGAKEAWNNAKVAREMAAQEAADIERVFTGDDNQSRAANPFSNVVGGSSSVSAAELERSRKIQENLNRLLRGDDASEKSRGKGKSDAEREAEALERSYESLLSQQRERIALLGTEGEVAQVTYDITSGSLKGLTQAQKDLLLENAKWIDFQRESAALEEVWADAARDQTDATIRKQQAFDEALDSIRDETVLIGKSAAEQEVWNNVKWAGAKANDEWRRSIEDATRELQRQREAMQDQIDIMDGIRDAGKGIFQGIRDGVNVWEALENAVKRVFDLITDKVFENVIDQLFGKQGDPGGGTWGDAIGSVLGTIFGGSRAGGGDALSQRPILVGEEGPELFVPRTNGRVLTAEQTARAMDGGSGGVNQYNNFAFAAPTSTKTQAQMAARVGYELRRAQRFGT